MTTTNTTAKYAGLTRNGFTGTQEDRELAFYQANGATSNSLTDAEDQFLVTKGFTVGTVDDKWTAYLVSLGYTGSKDDMINRWWGNFPGSTVNMDFTLGTLDSRITFTRASSANYFNSSGVLTSATTNTPRFDYDPVTLAPKGLLLEEARTNLLLRSDDFANASWSKTRSSITSNTVVAPDGTTTADKLVEDTTATSTHLVAQSVTLSINQTYTLSVFAKAGERGRIVLQTGSVANWVAEVQVGFDLTTGTLFTTGFGTSAGTITPVGNGWYRCSIVGTMKSTGTSGSLNIILCPNGTATYSYTGDGTSGAYIWGAQIELGSFITSYIPTVASQQTRAVENAIISGTNFSSWFNATQGTFYTEFTYGTKLASIRPFSLNDGTTNEVLEVVGASGAVPNLGAGVYWTGRVANVATIDTQNPYLTPTANGFRKFVGAYKVNDFASSCNGGTVGTDTVSAVPAVNRLVFEGYSGSGMLLNGHISKLVYYPYRLPNATLKALST